MIGERNDACVLLYKKLHLIIIVQRILQWEIAEEIALGRMEEV